MDEIDVLRKELKKEKLRTCCAKEVSMDVYVFEQKPQKGGFAWELVLVFLLLGIGIGGLIYSATRPKEETKQEVKEEGRWIDGVWVTPGKPGGPPVSVPQTLTPGTIPPGYKDGPPPRKEK